MKNLKNVTRVTSLLLASLILASCGFRRADKYDVQDSEETTGAPAVSTAATTPAPESEPNETASITTEHPVGIYFDLQNNGNYTRLTEWRAPWVQNTDIAVFDIIPSDSELLIGSEYKKIWQTEADKNWGTATPRHRFELYYVLNDGTEKTFEIRSPGEAEAVKTAGHLEVYLYDDIHQGEGWYSHLTDAEVTEKTVVSAVKITASDKIYDVKNVFFRVYSGMSESYEEVELIKIG